MTPTGHQPRLSTDYAKREEYGRFGFFWRKNVPFGGESVLIANMFQFVFPLGILPSSSREAFHASIGQLGSPPVSSSTLFLFRQTSKVQLIETVRLPSVIALAKLPRSVASSDADSSAKEKHGGGVDGPRELDRSISFLQILNRPTLEQPLPPNIWIRSSGRLRELLSDGLAQGNSHRRPFKGPDVTDSVNEQHSYREF